MVDIEERGEVIVGSISATEGGAGKAASIESSTALPGHGERAREVCEFKVGSWSEKETFFLRFWSRAERRLEPSLSEDDEFDVLRFNDSSSRVGESGKEEEAE